MMNADNISSKRKILNSLSSLLFLIILLLSNNLFAVSSSSTSCGKGLEFDGINDWVNIPNLSLTNDFTIEGWFNLEQGIDYRDVLFGQEGSGPDIHFTAGKVRLYAYGIRVTAKTALIANTWEHIAISRSGSNLTVFINGVKDATGRWSGPLSIKTIGRGHRGYFEGMMDEIRIWNIARTEAEISASYNTDVNPDLPGLIGYWSFNELDQIITDASSSANHASLGVSISIGSDDPIRLDLNAPFSEICDGGNSNQSPIANDDTVGPVVTGGTIDFTVTGNDTDNDGNLDAGSVVIVTAPSDGMATVNPSGSITYLNTGATTTDTLTYTVADTEGAISNVATVSITVTESTPVNVAPVALDDIFGPVELGGTISFSVTGNDVDSNGNLDVTRVTIVSGPNYGIATVNSSGTIEYENTGILAVTDTLRYTVADTEGAISNEATVSITVTSSMASCGKGIELDGINDWINIPDLILTNDFTIEGWFKLAPGIDFKDVLFGQEGAGPDIHFTAGRVRLYSYGIRVTANTPLVADTWGHIAITRSGSDLTVFINGEEDATGRWSGAFSIKAIGRGHRGYYQGMMDEIRIWNVARTNTEISNNYETSVNPDTQGLIRYWNFNESGQIIKDASSSANHGSLGASTAVGSDDPVRLGLILPYNESCETNGNSNVAPLAYNDSVGPVEVDGSISFSVTDNDVDSDGSINKNSLFIVSDPSHGSIDIDSVTGDITYTHDGSATSNDSFIYTVEDDQGAVSNEASVLITITGSSAQCGRGIDLDGSNDWVNIPNLSLANDFTIESWVKLAPGIDNKDALFGQEGIGLDINFYQGKVRLFAGGDRVTANTALQADIWGHIAITRLGTSLSLYINGVKDSSGIWNGTLSLKAIGRGNRGFLKGTLDEVRVWNIARTEAEISASFNTSIDPNTSGLVGYWTFNEIGQIITDASGSGNHGSLGISSVAGADDPLRFDSTAPILENCDDDSGGGSNVAPVAIDDTVGPVLAGETIVINVFANDSDIDGTLNKSKLFIVSGPNSGAVIIDLVTGVITYTHDGSETINDNFIYTIEDNEGAISNEATVSISITPEVNIAPVANNDDAISPILAGGTISIDVLANDSDSDGTLNNTKLNIVSGPSSGAVDIDLVTGEIRYTHDGSETINDIFIYTVEDNEGAISNEATVSILITDFSVLTPVSGDNVVDTGFTVSGTVSEVGGIASISVFDGATGHIATFNLEEGTWAVDLPPYSGGSDVTLTITATDTSGNQTDSSSIVVHVQLSLDITQARHLINRISYGITPSQLAGLKSGSFDLTAYKVAQLNPVIDSGCLASITVDQTSSNIISPFLTLPIATRNDLQNYAILMAAYNDCQLREVLTQFWDNHFNTSFDAVNKKSGGVESQTTAWELAENNAFRANALGNFGDLVKISAKSIAMLYYLDGNTNQGWNPNENYAREIMELHTLSVDGGYTDLDVVNVAKAFSGWTVADPDLNPSTNNSHFLCNPTTHDYSDIVLDLGDGAGATTIITPEPHNGVSSCELSGLAVIDRLVSRPVTGEFICQKLTELLVSDKKTPAVVNACKTAYLGALNDNDQIAQIIAAILNTAEFKNNDDYLDKVKTPLELEIGYLRNFNIVNSDVVPQKDKLSLLTLRLRLSAMSMSLFRFASPDGFPEQSVNWINSGLLLQRLAFISNAMFNTNPTYDISLDPTAFFAMNTSNSTADEIVDYLMELALQNKHTPLERSNALSILNNSNGFDGGSNDFDAETDASIKQNRLRVLLAVVLNYPGYQYQ